MTQAINHQRKPGDMAVFLISCLHPNYAGWVEHQAAHLDWLHAQVEAGALLASGPPRRDGVRTAFLIAKAEDEKAVRDWIAGDPYMVHGLTEELTITAWDPIFGAFAGESSLAGVSYEDLRRQILARFADRDPGLRLQAARPSLAADPCDRAAHCHCVRTASGHLALVGDDLAGGFLPMG
jgi:uncharacterized protein YciI